MDPEYYSPYSGDLKKVRTPNFGKPLYTTILQRVPKANQDLRNPGITVSGCAVVRDFL